LVLGPSGPEGFDAQIKRENGEFSCAEDAALTGMRLYAHLKQKGGAG